MSSISSTSSSPRMISDGEEKPSNSPPDLFADSQKDGLKMSSKERGHFVQGWSENNDVNMLHLTVEEVQRLDKCADPVIVEVLAGGSQRKYQSNSAMADRRSIAVFQRKTLFIPIATHTTLVTFRLLRKKPSLYLPATDAFEIAQQSYELCYAPSSASRQVTLTMKGSIHTIVFSYQYYYTDPDPLRLPPDVVIPPKRGLLLLEIRDAPLEAFSQEFVVSYGTTRERIDLEKQLLDLIILPVVTPTGTLKLKGPKGWEGSVEITLCRDGQVEEKCSGEGWVGLKPTYPFTKKDTKLLRVYLRWVMCFDTYDAAEAELGGYYSHEDTHVEIRAARGLPEDQRVCVTVLPEGYLSNHSRYRGHLVPWSTPSTLGHGDVEWTSKTADYASFHSTECHSVDIVLQRANDSKGTTMLASAKLYFRSDKDCQSWEGWLALRRGKVVCEVYVRWWKRGGGGTVPSGRPSLLSRPGEDTIDIVVLCYHEVVDTLSAFPLNTLVADIQPLLEERTSIPASLQLLSLAAKPQQTLLPHRTLKSYLPSRFLSSSITRSCSLLVRASLGYLPIRVGETLMTVHEDEPVRAIRLFLPPSDASLRLAYHGHTLENHLPVRNYRLKPLATLQLLPSLLEETRGRPFATSCTGATSSTGDTKFVEVIVVCYHEVVGKVFPFSIDEVIAELQVELARRTSIPVEHQVVSLETDPNHPLAGEKTLRMYGVRGGGKCNVVVRAVNGLLTLRVRHFGTYDEASFVTLSESEHVRALGLLFPPNQSKVHLCHRGIALQKNAPLSKYHFQPLSTLEWAPTDEASAETKKAQPCHEHSVEVIVVCYHEVLPQPATISIDAPIIELQAAIFHVSSIPVEHQVVSLETDPNHPLAGEKTLRMYGVRGGGKCHVMVRAVKGFLTLRVRHFGTDSSTLITVQDSEVVRALRRAMHLPPLKAAGPCLTFHGEMMRDGVPLKSYRMLKQMSTVYVSKTANGKVVSMSPVAPLIIIPSIVSAPRTCTTQAPTEMTRGSRAAVALRNSIEESIDLAQISHLNHEEDVSAVQRQQSSVMSSSRSTSPQELPDAAHNVTNASISHHDATSRTLNLILQQGSPFQKSTTLHSLQKPPLFTVDIICVHPNGTEHALQGIDYMIPLMSLRRRVVGFPPTSSEDSFCMYAGMVITDETRTLASLEPEANPRHVRFQYLYFVARNS